MTSKNKKFLDKNLGHHDFSTENDIFKFRQSLLEWFSENKRSLPWRDLCSSTLDLDQRAYSVWVSEIMLQQTQVATVIDYYNRWMKCWPTLQDLAQASLEQVNEMWAGLGYYSRGRRLLEGAKKVVEELGGKMPKTSSDLVKQLPGVGRYTAGAISSIALNEQTGVVDGNVIRVLSRLRVIGADSTNANTIEAFWILANKLVDSDNPGDFNQAMMELGALICTPKSPQCNVCPVQSMCMAYNKVDCEKSKAADKLKASVLGRKVNDIADIEEIVECQLCSASDVKWDTLLGVCNFPQKPKKKQAREETYVVGIIERLKKDAKELLIVQRPESGLLAGMWEFPSVVVDMDISEKKACQELGKFLNNEFNTNTKLATECYQLGEIVHVFSHLHHTYKVVCYKYVETETLKNWKGEDLERPVRWVNEEEFHKSAISTGMKKVFTKYKKKFCDQPSSIKQTNHAKKRKVDKETDGKHQRVLDSFFKRKTEK